MAISCATKSIGFTSKTASADLVAPLSLTTCVPVGCQVQGRIVHIWDAWLTCDIVDIVSNIWQPNLTKEEIDWF
jgi:hypothetical protein